MAYENSITIDEQEFNVAALTARQMRELSEDRNKPNVSNYDQNWKTICFSLNNYAKAHGQSSNFTVDYVADLPWPAYKSLNEAVAKVSGFDLVEPGNQQATETTNQ